MDDEEDVSSNNALMSLLGDLGAGAANSLPSIINELYNQNELNDLSDAAINNPNNEAAQYLTEANNYPNLLQYINSNIGANAATQNAAQMAAAQQANTQLQGLTQPQQDTAATNQALTQEEQVAQQGYTPIQRAAIQQALNGVISQEQGEQAAIAANQQARGQYGGGQQIDQEQAALQGAINNASNTTNETMANSYQQALNAIQNEGSLALTAGQQAFSQNAQIATAQDAINSLNTQLQQQAAATNAANQQAANAANASNQQATNLANQQAQLSLNNQETSAANQNVTNQQNEQNIASGLQKQAASDATAPLTTAYEYSAGSTNSIGNNVAGAGGSVANDIGSALGGALGAANSAINGLSSTGLSSTGASGLSSLEGEDNNIGDISSDTSSDLSNDFSSTGSAVDNDLENEFDSSDLGDLGFSTGGPIKGPGTETSDSIPVRLSDHEFVINAKSAQKYKPLVEAINDDDDDGILESLLNLLPEPDEEDDTDHAVILVGPRNGKPIDGQKALAQALRALSSVGYPDE